MFFTIVLGLVFEQIKPSNCGKCTKKASKTATCAQIEGLKGTNTRRKPQPARAYRTYRKSFACNFAVMFGMSGKLHRLRMQFHMRTLPGGGRKASQISHANFGDFAGRYGRKRPRRRHKVPSRSLRRLRAGAVRERCAGGVGAGRA